MFHWLDVERIAEELADAHPDIDPTAANFVELRDMVERLDGFEAQPGHPVNERILETIQALWTAERDDDSADDD